MLFRSDCDQAVMNVGVCKCGRPDLNRHALSGHSALNAARLPIPPPRPCPESPDAAETPQVSGTSVTRNIIAKRFHPVHRLCWQAGGAGPRMAGVDLRAYEGRPLAGPRLFGRSYCSPSHPAVRLLRRRGRSASGGRLFDLPCGLADNNAQI